MAAYEQNTKIKIFKPQFFTIFVYVGINVSCDNIRDIHWYWSHKLRRFFRPLPTFFFHNKIPDKSRDVQIYQKFMKWKESEGIDKNDFPEVVVVAYFGVLDCNIRFSLNIAKFYASYTFLQRNTSPARFGPYIQCCDLQL